MTCFVWPILLKSSIFPIHFPHVEVPEGLKENSTLTFLVPLVPLVDDALLHRYALALPTLNVPTALTTTVGRPWLVPFMSLPVWARWAAFFPALMSTVLLFMDQNITVRLVNSKQHKLKKG